MRHTVRLPYHRVHAVRTGGTTAINPVFITVKNEVGAVSIRRAWRTHRSSAVNTDFIAVHRQVGARRTRSAVPAAVDHFLVAVENSIVAEVFTRAAECSSAVDAGLIAILNAVAALRTSAAFSATIDAGLAQFGLPDAIDTVVARLARAAAVNELLVIIQDSVKAVWRNFVVVVQTAGQEKRSGKCCHKYH